MTDMLSDKDDLAALFEAAKAAPPAPSSDFMARVLSDAEAMQPAALGGMRTPAPTPKRGAFTELLSGLSDAIGGWPGFAGLASAAVAGVWIGISPPDGLIDPISSVLGTDTSSLSEALDYNDGFDFTLFEG